MNNFQKVLYKTLIEIAEVDEELHLSEICRSRSFNYCLYFSEIHL